MKPDRELFEKAKAAKSAEELLEMAKAEHIELTAEQAEKTFKSLHGSGELTDEESDNVTGGCSKYSPGGAQECKENVVHLYKVNQKVEVIDGIFTNRAVILELCIYMKHGHYCPSYKVRFLSNNKEKEVTQVSIAQP